MAAPNLPPPATANTLINVPVSVLNELLTKYGFIPTSRDLAQNIVQSFDWQQSDEQFRQFAVTCTGFTANDGVVFVNRDVLSLISRELKVKIGRDEPIVFDCGSESFATVMTFLHTINGSRPTAEFLLKLLPMLRDCKLSFLSDLCAICINDAPVTLADRFVAAFHAENELMLEFGLNGYDSRSELRSLLEECNGFRDLRETAFGGKAMGRILDMLLILPENDAGAARPESPEFAAAKTCITTQFSEHLPVMLERSQCLAFEIRVGNESVFTSRQILAQASRFFQQLFLGDFAEQHLQSYSIENGTLDEVHALLDLVLPTAHGMLWRLTTAPVGPVSPEPKQRPLMDELYRVVFNEDPAWFVNVFKLAEYFQITGLVAYLTEVALCCLPWRQRLQLADLLKSRELMASLLTDDTLKELKQEMVASAKVLEEFSGQTKDLIIEFFLRAANF